MKGFLAVLGSCLILATTALADPPTPPAEVMHTLTVELIDADGRPVEGAEVGLSAGTGGPYRKLAAAAGTEWHYYQHAHTDATGRAEIVHLPRILNAYAVVARHEQRKIAACAAIDDQAATQPVKLTLMPEVEVRAQVRCDALIARGRQIFPACAEVQLDGKRVSATCNETGNFQISLPPGRYILRFDSHLHRTELTNTPLVVKAQAEPLDLGCIELTAAKVELLVGEPAPEIPDVVAWKNTPPLKFSDLRGRVVLLDFWGEWCGSCVADMPGLFALHDKYHDQGLSIVGVHVDKTEEPAKRLDTVARLDDRLSEVRHGPWKDRDIPFPVALMVGDRAKYGAGISGLPRSAEHAAYGVTMFPTQVLIDRRGNVAHVFVGGISWHEDGLAALEKALAEK